MSTVITSRFDTNKILPEALTLVDLLRLRASIQPEQLAYTFLLDGEEEEANISYGELDRQARAIAASLQPLVSPGDRVLLLYPPGLEYIAAFFGCLYAGAVAVPAYPPRRNRNLLRLQSLVADAQAAVALTTGTVLARMAPLFSENPYLSPLRWLTSDSLSEAVEDNWEEPILTGADLAFLQYTSGSTSLPKGVMLSHGNLLHNERVIQSAFGQTAASVIMGWLPLYHDMGLIGNVIQPLFVGARCVLMSPAAFLQRPFRWLQAISRYRATTSGGPNFAYDLCARKCTEDERATLDLSSWQVAFNGSEPIRHESIENFARTFETCGFRREAFYPCYGLAEATLIVSGRLSGGAPVVKNFDAGALENNLVVEAEAGVAGAKTLVGSGETLLEQEIVIVHPQTLARSLSGEVGEIWVSSPSIARGYWNQPEQTGQTFGARIAGTSEGPYLRTGDLGFFSDGELFVTGRLKDLIIIRGLNHYPQDIELTVERSHEALRPGCVAAFSVELEGEERLVVVQEADHRRQAEAEAICEAVVGAVAETHEVQVYAVVLIKPGTIAKTSSGKIQRHACRAAFLESSLDVIGQLLTGVHTPGAATHAALPTLPIKRNAEAIEGWLRSLLAANLGVEASRIDVNQSVVRYGIDSLAAIELAHAVEASLGIVLPVTTFLQSPSIADITVGVLEQLDAPRPVREAARSMSQKNSGEHPLSHGQQALWFLHEMAPESAAYNLAGAARILSELDVAALRRAFQGLVKRHAVLRTTFHIVDGKPVQRVSDDSVVSFELEEHDDSSGEATTLPERLVESAGRPFDLRQGPPLRVNLFRGRDGEHVLLLSVHHIVADFWSLAVLAHELGALYEGELQGIPAKLAPLTLQYTDVVRWQEEALQSSEGELHWDYWRQGLANEPAALNLPTDRPRPHLQTFHGASHLFELDAELTTQLKTLSQEHGTTLYMTLLAAFQTLLARYTQQTDIAVGSPTASRRWAEAAGLVGYFVNPVVMRGDLSGNPNFRTLLERTRQTVLDAFKHQDFPFPLLVERLHPTRETSRSPLFQVQFILQKAHVRGGESLSAFAAGVAGARINLGVLTLESLPLEQRVAQFDLTLSVAELNGRLAASFQYNTDLFDAATIERMSEHFRLLLESIAGDAQQSLSELAMLSEAERHQLLVEWNDTAVDYPIDLCIHQLFELQVERTPDTVAVIFGEQQLTYREVNKRANQLAHQLIQLGVLPESRVGVLLERSSAMIISLLAILKSGAAYLPLDPAYPQERVRFMLEDARASILISQHSLSDLPASSAVPLLLIDDDSLSLHSTDNPSTSVSAHNLAYLIYTSGSTGVPKGVAIEHLNASMLLLWAHESFSDAQLAGVLASTSICFDLSVFEIFVPLSCGATVIVAHNALALSELGHVARSAVTLINTVPSAMTELLRLGAVPESVKVVNLAGEALSRRLADEVYSLPQVEEVYNLYGPSEDTTYSTFTLVPSRSPGEPTIGRPVANTSVYILDADLRLLAQGIAGQLYLSGSGLARGYLNRPDLTAASFLPDPFSSVPGSRLYRTGDLARRASNGEIEYLGRIDQQVKVRGYRIELGEIEAALMRERAVEAAAVVVREEGSEKRLVAYVVGRAGEEIRERELRAGIKQSLPEYMMPSVFVMLEEMPLTANGKIDRKRLPTPDHVRPGTSGHYVGARTEVEEAISSIWVEVLKVRQVEVHDNFFELGGHSLLATQAMSRLKEAFQVEMPLRSMFENPTVGELAVELEATLRAGAGVQAPPLRRVGREQALPLSFAQQRLWFLDQLEPDSSFYNIPMAVRLSGRLNVEALESALTEIIRRHESLRTSFGTQEGQPVQIIHEAGRVRMPVTDLSRLTDDEGEAEALRLASIEARQPFDLSTVPLVRAGLLRLSEEEHVVLLTMHHIISDGWSMGVLIRETSLLYQAYSAHEEPALEELAIQYADYAHWQREWLQGEVLEEQLSYWRTQLGVQPAVLKLLTDRPRPAIQTFRGATHAFSLDKESAEKLREASRREGVTMFMLLLAAFQTLLYRYTGAEQINVGTPIANRTRMETEGLIGFFVNTLVLRAELDGKAAFRELLMQVRETALGAYAHQDVPFEKLVEELQPERSLSHSPLFQVMFAWQNTPEGDLQQVGELRMRAMGGESRTAKFELTLTMSEAGEEIGAAIEYNTDLFDASMVARMAGHFTTLLQSAAAEPSQRVSDLTLLTSVELSQLLRGWNDTAASYDARQCLHQLFEAQAERTPEVVAVTFESERLTYRELDARANQLARHLRTLGVAPEVLVGVCFERSIEMVVALLGVLKAGGAYVPVDPAYPQARVAYVLDDTRTPVLLTQSNLADALSGHGVRVVCLDTHWPEVARASVEAFDSGVTGDNLAYAIYTSGSTGQPKGAMNTHRAIRNRLLWMQGEYELTAADRILQKTPFSFDVSVWEFFWPLMTGACLVVARPGGHQDPAYLVETIEREQITTLHFVPSMLHVFLEEKSPARCSSLRRVICSGEALPNETQERFFERMQAKLYNLYGPTEAAVDVTGWECERDPDRHIVPIGRPVSNTEIHLLDGNMNLLPDGVAGELHIGGVQLARGYLNRPDLTAERFVPNPFGVPGARLYKTGDLARRLSGGEIEFLGRLDYQVKIRGFRVELGEIEAVLAQHPSAAEVVVLAKDAAQGQKRLVAYVVAGESPPAATELRAHLKEKLPDYMIPAAYVMLAEMPVTQNGKVDRRALLNIGDAAADATEQAYVAPRTVTEELLGGIWGEVLGVERVGVYDNFFDLGGHSLLATQVVSRVRENFTRELALREMFEYPTVSALAERIEACVQAEAGTHAPPVRAVERDGRALPLSFGQQRLWFLNQLEPESSLYNISGGVRLTGALDIAALERTLSEVVRRHEALRTTFTMSEGEPVQVINETHAVILPVNDLSGTQEAAREAQAMRLAREEAARPFDFARGPLMRVSLLKLAADDHVLLVTMHHIVSDGWSVGVLIKEIGVLYESFVKGEPTPLAELKVQYADYAAWQREWLRDEVLDNQLSYWKRQLNGAQQVLELPTDRPRPPVQTYRGAHQMFELSEDLSARLRELSRREGVTLYMTLLAAFQTLLARYTAQDDILVGADIANRQRGETEELIGFFVNLLALRGDLTGDPTFAELLGRTREACLEAYAHQELPFEKLVEELDVKRDMSRAPIFQVLFVLQNAPAGELELPGLRLSRFKVGSVTSKFDLLLNMEEIGRGIEATLEYSTDLFDALTIQRMAAHLQILLAGIAENPDSRLSALPLLTTGERLELLAGWRNTTTGYPRALCIHQLFEAQAARTPEAVALVFADEQVTYAELNRRANQLAHYLRRQGVGPDVFVGLCVERSIEMIVGLLGILKAGGAYVPLDAQYPLARLAFMLADAQAPVLLTQERLLDSLPAHWGQVVCLDTEWELIADGGDENPRHEVNADNLAYVMYTSGSTGQPKGVCVPHRAVVRLVTETNYAQFGPEEVFLQLAPISFDASTFEVWGALLHGARLAVMPPQPPSLEEIGAALARHRVTTLWLTAGLFHLMTDERPADLRQVRQLLAGGDVLSPSHVGKYLSGCANSQRLINGYGPTEGTTFTCCHTMTAQSEVGASVPVGVPVANTQVYVLDARMGLVPAGVGGNLYIGGDGLARGYLNRPGLTAEKFIPNPFGAEAGARLYETGDRARFLADGRVEFLGRDDQQVKIRGFRIELGEIDAALGQHRLVREAVVVAHEDGSGDKRLAAYVVAADSDEPPTAADLRGYLSGKLPEYMLPSFFVVLDELPLTANGKVDRRALPAPDIEHRPTAVEATQARTPVEELLANIWCEVLGLERMGIEEDFFELGGHSLLATQVVSRVRERFGVELALRELFEHPTVAGLASRINEGMQGEAGTHAPPVRAVERDGRALPLSFGQQRLWFLNQLEPESTLYNLSGGIRLTGELNVEAFARTLSEVVRRHEVLRTTFTVVDREPAQVIEPASSFELNVRDLSHLGTDEWAQAERAAAREESERPFELEQAPLMRAALLRFNESEYVLLVTMHHIVSDGWSIGVLIREVAALYEAYSSGKESPLVELSIQYADYAAWQREWLQGDVLDNQLSYWKRQLNGAQQVLELPTDRPRPPVQTYRGAHQMFELSEDLSARLRELSRREGVTLYMTLLAAFQTLLARYTAQDDILVGTPIANRQRGETEELIGFFVNLLTLRGDLTGDPTFAELLGRTREACLEAYAHQELPFEKLVEELDVKRDMSRAPIFQVLFVLQNAPMPPIELGNLVMTPLAGDASMSHFDLTLDVVEEKGGLRCTLEYNSDLFDAATSRRIISHLETLLDGVATNPGLRLSALPLLTAADERRQLIEWNDTASDYPSNLCVHQLFEAQAGRTPHAPAVAFEDQRLSYAEVNRRADAVARYLVESGAGPETLVALLLERSAEAVICLLGVLKAGAAYLPIDPTYPAERIAFMLADASARLLLTQRRLVEGLPAHAARVLCIEECVASNGEGAPVDTSLAAHPVAPDNLAYVIYTSGSTGKPKGVMIPHRSVVNHNFAVAERYALCADDRVLQFASLSFDVAVEEIFPTWLAGGCVVVRPDRALDSHRSFLDLLERERVTVVNLSTPYWNELIAELSRTNASLSASLRLAAIGGEKGLPEHFALSRQAMSPAARLLNVYGPTETTVTNTAQDFDAAHCTSPSVPIGRPLHNTRLYVLDRHLRPAPVGVCGELFIGGHSLARGYLERPELTAEKFPPDPYSTEAGARMYGSGDMCRLLASGEVEFVGRVDEQVKVRGFRVELGEIESALAQHPQVRHTLVLAGEEAAGGKRLIAYVVGDAGEQATTADLRAYLKERLPDYMVPSFFVHLDEFPLTANGKVDRRLLPKPSESIPEADAYVVPRTEIEEMVCGLLGDVLGRERVGLNDDFFELGGHSLLATQVMSRVREAFDVEMPLRTLFEHPKAGALAQQIEEAIATRRGLQAPAIGRASRTGLLPLSFAQQRLWLLDQLQPGNAFYNVPVAVRLKGGLKLAALERTLSEVVRRHEVLRTTLTVVGDDPVQVIHEARPLSLPVEDLSRLEPAERSPEAERLTREEAERPFDLERGPLLRAALLQLAPEEHIILLTMHHVVSDGWSIGVLIKEVAALYESYSEGQESPLAELPVQYADYAVWQREYLRGEVLERQLSYWRRQLAGARQVLELPTDYPRPPVQTFGAATAEFGLGDALSAHVKRLSREQGCTLYMTLMAGFEVLLGRYSGQEDMLIGTAIANRQRVETESLIGFFVNTLVMRADLSREPTFAELMGRVREVALGAYAHQDVPFERLVEEIAPERSLSQTPLFQVAFGVYNESEQKLEIAGLEVSGADSVTEIGRFDLTLWMWEERSGEIRGRWIYNTDLFEAGTVARMSRHLTRLLESAMAAPSERIGKLAMLTDEEIDRQLQRKKKREDANIKKLKASRRQAVTSIQPPPDHAGTDPQD